jgi:tetratricopeptide (TPR) repeat protein
VKLDQGNEMSESWPDLDEAEKEFLAVHGETVRSAQARQKGCPSAQLILAASGESLPEELRTRVSEHLAQCGTCRMLAEDLTAAELLEMTPAERAHMRARMEPILGVAGKSNAWSWLRTWVLRPIPLATMAAVVLAVGTFVFVQSNKRQPPAVASIPQPAPPVLVAATLPLEKPMINIPPDSDLVWRSGKPGAPSLGDRLEAALAPYKKDDYAGSAKRLEQLEKRYPQNNEVKFYDGICHLFLGDTAGAIRQLEAAKRLAKPQEGQQASWYLAIAYQRAGQNDLALAELQALCKADGPYAARACEVLKTVSPH